MATPGGITFGFLPLSSALCREVSPFNHGAEVHGVFADYRVGNNAECTTAHLKLAREGTFEVSQQLALMRRAGMKHVDVAAENIIGVEVRKLLTQVDLRVLEHLLTASFI